MIKRLLSILCCILLASSTTAQTKNNVSFALHELLSEFQNIRDFSMSSDGKEVYFTAQDISNEVSVIIRADKIDSSWAKQLLLTPSGMYKDLEPFLAPNGLKLYFASNRPLSGSKEIKEDFDIWYLERPERDRAWSPPINIGTPINSKFNEFYPAVSNNGNLYFTSDRPEGMGKDDIYRSEWLANSFQLPTSLSDSVNSIGYEFNAYISPKEDFMIFSGYNRDDGLGSADLYISFQKPNGSWSGAKNLGSAVNSNKMDYCPFIDLTTNTLYLTSKRSDLTLKPFNSLQELKIGLNSEKNGQSKVYKTSFESSYYFD